MKSYFFLQQFWKLLFVLILFNACADTKFAEKKLTQEKANFPYDAVIVPGLPIGENTGYGSLLAARIQWAAYLYKIGATKNIIFSGSAVATPYLEGLSMKLYAEALNIPVAHVFAEIKAEHTTENLWYAKKLADSLGFQKLAMASDPFQTKMMGGFLKKKLPKMATIPVVFKIVDPEKDRKIDLPVINLAPAFQKNFIPLSARESFAERWRGTRGKHINFAK